MGMQLRKESYFFGMLFIISVSYAFFLTEQIPFFWEDINYFNEAFWENTTYYGKEKSYTAFYKDLTKTIFDTDSFYSIGYSGLNERPLTSFMWRYAELFFGRDLFNYRLAKALFFGILALIIALISRQFLERPMTFVLILAYITMPHIWYGLFANADEAILMHAFTLFALFMYFFKYQYETNTSKLVLYGLIIFFSTRASILFKHEGRILYVGLFVYLTIKNYKELFFVKNFLLIAALALISSPIVGFMMNGTTAMDFHAAKFVNDKQTSWSDFFFDISVPLKIIGPLFFLLLASVFVLFRKRDLLKKEKKSLLLFLTIFFIIELGITFFAHGFKITIQDFGSVTFIFFTALYILITFFCADRTKQLFTNTHTKKLFTILFFILTTYLIMHNLYRTNQLRGAWGDYVIGFNDLNKYVDARFNNALLLVESSLTTTPVALSKNTIVPFPPHTNSSVVKEYAHKYEFIFIASRSNLHLDPVDFDLVLKQKANDLSWYGVMKAALKRTSNQEFYLYKLRNV